MCIHTNEKLHVSEISNKTPKHIPSVYCGKKKHVKEIYCGEEDCYCNNQYNFVACENSDEDSCVDVVSDNSEHTHNTHEKEISFVCDVCNIKFSDADSLKSHQPSHVKAKGYVYNKRKHAKRNLLWGRRLQL
ncbi:hypothetical protein CEXT_682621 [Caerostris extrusa]|uniref:C2H2-type domain-containing protein n=1 Tax=Caerostris extrusa TaxID=172846 RepID=A0AAV4QP86_CAEEX|nr:hypothetical protein CEXT_682621 [Caerostris extrusa]